MVNPAPVMATEVTVTGTFPVELRVSVCEVDVLTATVPKEIVDALIVNVGLAAINCRLTLLDTPAAAAVSTTVCAVLTDVTVARKIALVDPAAIKTDVGTITDLLLLVTVTIIPVLGAGELRVTVQESVPDPVIDPFVQESALSTGGGRASVNV